MIYLSAVGLLPVNDRFALDARTGLHRWDAGSGREASGGEDRGTDPTYGIGAQYRISERPALRTEFARVELQDFDIDGVQVQARSDF